MKSLRKCSSISLIIMLMVIPLAAQTDVTVDIGDVIFPAYTSDLQVPVTLTGPVDAVAGIQFDIIADPAIAGLTSALANVTGFTADFNSLSGDTNRVILYNSSSVSGLPAAGDTVLWLGYEGSQIASAVIDLAVYGLVVSDTAGAGLTSSSVDGSISIGSVVSLSMDTGTGDNDDLVSLVISLNNPDEVGGVQFDLIDIPDYVVVDSIWTSARTVDFTISTTPVGVGERVILFSDTNESIAAGSGAIINVRFRITPTAYNSDVIIDMVDAVITDPLGGTYWIAGITPGIITVYPGYLEPPTSLVATSGLDGHVPLAWAPPTWDIPGDTVGEGFEGTVFPPVDWTQIQTCTDETAPAPGYWSQTDGNVGDPPIGVHSGAANAGLWWSYDAQDEWLITPEIALGGNMELTFWSYGYEGSTNGDHYYVKISTDGGSNWTELLDLTALTLNDMNMWEYPYVIDLSYYSGETVQLAWQAVDGDGLGLWYIWFIDDIFIGNSTGRVYSYETGAREMVFDASYKKNAIAQAAHISSHDAERPTQTVIRNSNRDSRDLTAYNIYRSLSSPVAIIQDNLLSAVPYTQEIYDDVDVENSLTYYYVITADYGAMGESGPSNEDSGTPVEWVELAITGGTALTGQTDTLEITLNNESPVSSFFFEVADLPNYIAVEQILSTPRTAALGYLDALELPDGKMSISGGFGSHIAPGSDAICRLVVRAIAPEPGVANLNIVTANVEDALGNVMHWTQTGATFDVTVETQSIMLSGATGIGTATVSLILHNTQNIHGIQMTLVDAPGLLSGLSILPTGNVDLSNWVLDGNEIDGAYIIIGFDNTLTNPIEPGMHHIADITFSVSSNPDDWGTIVDLSAIDVVLSDVNSIQMFTEIHTSSVSIGFPEATFSIENLQRSQRDNTGTFDIHINNQIQVYAVQLDILDLPNYLELTDVTPIAGGPFVGATIDPLTGEQADGVAHIFAYDLLNGIAPTMGAILRVGFEVKPEYPGAEGVMLMIEESMAADQNFQAMNSMATGFILFEPVVSVNVETPLPEKFALYSNYPNPFNPTTNIKYDLSEVSKVRLTIYDLMGREVRTLVNKVQSPGRIEVSWNGTDQFGHMVGAGVYLYRVQANQNTATGKMIFLK